jgi:hypothetical protein
MVRINLTEFIRQNDIKYKDGEEFSHKEKP